MPPPRAVVHALKFGYHPRMHASNDTSADAVYVRRLVVLFGLAYFAQGLGQAGGLISQPLNYYLKSGLGLNPAQVSEDLAILTLPWVSKPLYGVVSEYLPLFGDCVLQIFQPRGKRFALPFELDQLVDGFEGVG